MNPFFVALAIASEEKFRQLEAVVVALREAKKAKLFSPKAYWLEFLIRNQSLTSGTQPKQNSKIGNDDGLQHPLNGDGRLDRLKHPGVLVL